MLNFFKSREQIAKERVEEAARTGASKLDLSNLKLTSLPKAIGQLSQLQRLDVTNNELTSLPEAIGQLSQLQTLAVTNNELTSLPEAIGQLSQLQILSVTNNELTSLPEAIGQLSQLQRLDVSSNKLTSLPEAIGQLSQLQRLDVSSNKLTSLPASLRHLDSLKRLYLHDNPALNLPPEILGPTQSEVRLEKAKPAKPSDILEYYFRSQQGRPLNEAKLILVGRGGAGKTSLVNLLKYGTFDPREKKTPGISITPWELTLQNEKVRLNIWDFGGQEIMHATHQFFLTQRSVYLLVINAREGEQDANVEYWLRIIESFGAESPVIVVINKIKDHAFDLNRRGLQQKFPMIQDFIQTDCKDETGLKELRQAIERETNQLEHLRDPLKQVGSVEIPQEAFLSILRVTD